MANASPYGTPNSGSTSSSPKCAHSERVSSSSVNVTAMTTTCGTVYGPPQIRPPPGQLPITSGCRRARV
ncbi:hypothetical protein [Streptomyces sp. NPDC053560]|uniref:hypothetical protein n=1 Tax=Streptomyces sp. NPDC053560 TaxID=3365711 RepID=UPI0037D16E42